MEVERRQCGVDDVGRREHTGIVHQDIDLAKGFLGDCDDLCPVILVTDIVANKARVGAQFASDCLPLFVDIGEHDARAFADEAPGLIGSLSACRAADDGDFTLEPVVRHDMNSCRYGGYCAI